MECAFKLVGVFSVLALTVFPAGSPAQSYLSDATVCRRAINSDRTGWVEGAYAKEAERRGLTFRGCDEMNNLPPEADAKEGDDTFQEQWVHPDSRLGVRVFNHSERH